MTGLIVSTDESSIELNRAVDDLRIHIRATKFDYTKEDRPAITIDIVCTVDDIVEMLHDIGLDIRERQIASDDVIETIPDLIDRDKEAR